MKANPGLSCPRCGRPPPTQFRAMHCTQTPEDRDSATPVVVLLSQLLVEPPIAPESAATMLGRGTRCPMIQILSERMSQNDEGQGLAEYALILALIAIVAIVALMFLGGQMSTILSDVGNSI